MPPTTAIDPRVLERVASLTYRARRAVHGALTGMHRSPHRGASVVFVEHRDYRPGDDPRLIDWRAYARSDRYTIKRFEQEAHLRALLLLDVSGSMAYSSERGPAKIDHAATLLAALGYVLLRQSDAAGAALIDEHAHDYLPPRARSTHFDAIAELFARDAKDGTGTNLGDALREVSERGLERGVIAVASDLLDTSGTIWPALQRLAQHGNDVIVFHVLHPDELTLPFDRASRFLGFESEPAIDADPNDVRDAYRAEVRAFLSEARARTSAIGAHYSLARTDEPAEHVLAAVLQRSRGPWA